MKLALKKTDLAAPVANPSLSVFPGGSLLDVPDALAFLGIPDTPAARAWMNDEFTPMSADEFMMIPRREIEAFANHVTDSINAARTGAQPPTLNRSWG